MVEFHIWSWFKFTTASFNNPYIYPILQLFKTSQGVLPRIVACIPMIFPSPYHCPKHQSQISVKSFLLTMVSGDMFNMNGGWDDLL